VKLDLPFHPLIFGILPLYHLYTENLVAVHPHELIIPVAIIVLFVGLLYGIAILLSWDVRKTGIGLSVFFIWFFSYGFILQFYNGVTLAGIGLANYPRYLIALSILLLVCILWLLRRPGWSPESPTRFLNIVGIVLLILTTLTLVVHISGVTSLKLNDRIGDGDLVPSTCTWNSSTARDVYYIVLDTYARGDVLEQFYNYNNSGFLSYLAGRGFRITTGSVANYQDSKTSLASSLNMEYLGNPADADHLLQSIEYNRISRIFKEHGFTIIHFRSGFSVTERNAYADIVKNTEIPTPFHNKVVESTLLRYLITIPNRRYAIDNAFSDLSLVPEIGGKKFIFVHIASAVHPPYVIGEHGEWLFPRFGDEDYINQLKYINGRVEDTIDRILSESETPPIIILQADHGPRVVSGQIRNVSLTMPIFNAYYLPDAEGAVVYDTITPVNSFRAILNKYYGCSYTILADRSFYNDKWYEGDDIP